MTKAEKNAILYPHSLAVIINKAHVLEGNLPNEECCYCGEDINPNIEGRYVEFENSYHLKCWEQLTER